MVEVMSETALWVEHNTKSFPKVIFPDRVETRMCTSCRQQKSLECFNTKTPMTCNVCLTKAKARRDIRRAAIQATLKKASKQK